MFLGRIHSPANPIQGSAFSTYGYKPSGDILTFSVGDQATLPDSYVTKLPDGSMPTISISDSILTFSHPQTHPYIGVGDKVSWASGDVYISDKISTRQWRVKKNNGDAADGLSSTSLVSIDKVFATLSAAINNMPNGASTLIGSSDLVLKNLCLQIACYEKVSNNSGKIDVTGWTTSRTNYIKIFVPRDIKTECNQRNTFTLLSNAGTALIEMSNEYVVVKGLALEEDGACSIGVHMQGNGIVSDCKIKGFTAHGIFVFSDSNEAIIARNTIYGGAAGIGAKKDSKVICNTLYGNTTGCQFISSDADSYCVNNIAAGNTTDFLTPPATTDYCASEDASAIGAHSVPSTTINFYDAAGEDFRITNANDNDVIRAGLDLSAYDLFPITEDANGDPVDNTPSLGALHMVRRVPYAIGDTATDLKTAGNITSVVGGLITFSVAQANDLIAAGDIVQPGNLILTEKLSTTQWRSTLASGAAPADVVIPAAITSIFPQYNSVAAYIADVGSPKNLVASDIRLDLVCVEVTGSSSDLATIESFTSDETRSINVYAPYNTATECNTRRRHLGVWDDNLMSVSGIIVENSSSYVNITGIQVDGDIDSTIETVKVESCIVKNGGVYAAPRPSYPASIAILNNVVYDGHGIDIVNQNTNASIYEFAIYNNTVYNCDYGVKFDVHGVNKDIVNHVRLINNLLIDNEFDIFCDDPRGSTLTSESNWTSGSPGMSLAFGFNNDAYRSVTFVGLNDFHIPLFEHVKMTYGYPAYADHFLQSTIDIDSSTRPTTSYWSIGADQYSAPSKQIAFFSVGHETGDLQGDVGMDVSVVGSIATFASSLDNAIGIGDKVTMAGHTVYLAEKGTASIWRVVDNVGASVANFDDTLTDIKRVSNSLDAAMSTGIALEFGGGVPDTDLVTATAEIRVECYQDDSLADTAQVVITGWTTSATYCMAIETPYDTNSQCGTRQRHEGVWDDDYYHMSTVSDSILLANEYVTIDGLQIDSHNNEACEFSAAEGSSLRRCILRNVTNGTTQDADTYNIYLQSNIVYGISVNGLIIQRGYGNNNTVIAGVGTTAFAGPATATFVNNIAQGIGAGYSGAATLISCISEDATAIGTGCKTSVILSFLGGNDYHLARDDFEALNFGADHAYNPDRDIDSELIIEHSIGADCQNLTTVSQTFSCGQNTADLVGPLSGLRVIVSGGIATFSTDIDEVYPIMTGDTIDYDTGHRIAYLNKKISSNSWSIVNHVGVPASNNSSAIVNSIKRTFNFIENVFEPTSSLSIAQFSPYGDSANKFLDLSRAKLQINIALDMNSTNVNPVIISGFTTDEESYLRLYAPSDIDEYNALRPKHTGVNVDGSTTASRIIYNASAIGTGVILLNTDYTQIDGVVIKGISTIPCICINAANCKILNNILYNGAYGITYLALSQRDSIIVNNIIYDNAIAGIKTTLKDYLYNNTIAGSPTGVVNTALSISKNNVVRCTACYSGLTTNVSYCMVNDTSIPSGSGNIRSTTVAFKNYAGKDFNLNKSDQRGKGTILTVDTVYSFSIDAIENTRGRFWDMGALEYQATKVAWFSVGNTAANNLTGTSVHGSVADGIITFSQAQTGKIISGDAVWKASSIIGYLGEKISEYEWEIKNQYGAPATGGAYDVFSIKRVFHYLSAYFEATLSSILGTKDLTSLECQVNITVSDDTQTPYTTPCELNLWTCDSDYFIRIFAPIDTAKHCNTSHRHRGKIGAGAVFVTQAAYSFQIYRVRYLEIIGLIVENTYAYAKGMLISESSYLLIDSNIIRNFANGAIHVSANDAMLSGTINVIVNNVLSNCGNHGISIEGSYANIFWIMNNTIFNCGRGIYHIKGIGASTLLYVYNNICQDNIFADFVEDNVPNTGKFNLYYNISRDETAGSLNHNLANTIIQFVARVAENFAPDRTIDSIAINSALDMRSTSPYYYFEDARGVDREEGQWDRGAIEQNEIIGFGTLYLGPLLLDHQFGYVTSDFPDKILYLRNTFYDNVPLDVQFHTIADLNAYLATNLIDNIIVYVEANWSFDDATFSLGNREDRTVRIMTDPDEIEEGPASIIYPAGGLVDDTSIQSTLTFENLKLYSENAMGSDYLIPATSPMTKLILINCITQVNEDALVDAPACVVEVANSIILYLNNADASLLYLAKNTLTGHKNFNTMLIIDSASDKEFRMATGLLEDYVENNLSFNIGGGEFDIYAPGRKDVCIENEDPLFTEIESFTSPSDIMTSNFKPLVESPAINTGDDLAVSLYTISTDIDGNDRQSFGGTVDIGPYEIRTLICDLQSSDIKSIDQVKIDIDRVNARLLCADNNTVYNDLYSTFQYRQEEMESFVREKKIVIALKKEPTILLSTDKVYKTIDEFEAYYDGDTKTIVLTKNGSESALILGKILENDAYFLHFDEKEHKLYLLLNEAVSLSISGTSNPIKNVRFGGNPIFNL